MYQDNILKFFLSIIKPYKYWYLLIFQAPIIGAFFNPVNNYVIKLIVDKLNSNNILSINLIIMPIILYCSASIMLEVAWRIANFADYKISPRIEAEIINKAYFMLFSHKYEFFQNNLSGKLASKINSLRDSFVRILDLFRFGIIWQVGVIIITLVMMFIVNLKLGFGVLLWLIVFMPTMFLMKKRGLIYSQNTTNKKQKISGFINDNISNIATILFFASKKQEQSRIISLNEEFITTDKKRLKFIFINHFIMGFVYSFLSISVLFILINLRIKNLISTGDLVMVIGLTFSMIESSWNLLNNLDDLVNEFGKIKESFSIFQQDFIIIEPHNISILNVKNPKIEFRNLKYSYPKSNLLFNDFNLKINAGEKVGLVGISGSGKSTLTSLLLRLFETNSGEILIDDCNISKISLESLRSSIAIIPQEASLFHRSIGENISYGKFDATQEEIIEATKKAKIYDFIMTLPQGFDTLVGERGVKLSGGQKQRISIARAFLKNSSILILDEATSALDSETESDIQNSINEMLDNKKTTVIAIAHRLSTIRHLDRIIVLEKGEIIEDGKFFDLLSKKNGKFKNLWEHQSNGIIL